MKAVVFKTITGRNRPGSKVHVHADIRFQGRHATDPVEIFHMFGIVKPAGTFGKGYVSHTMLP